MATRHATMRTARTAKPRSFWQGMLIVLPVIVLAGAGFVSLRQDQALARREAQEKAQDYADQIAETLWHALTDPTRLVEFSNHTFRINSSRQIIAPPPVPGVPAQQPFDLSTLDERQRQRWLMTQEFVDDADQRSNAIAAGRELLALEPPAGIAAATQYRLGLLLDAGGQKRDAIDAFATVASRFPDTLSESGLSLPVLAEWQRLQLVTNTFPYAALENFCSNLVAHPSFLTPQLLAEAAKRTEPAGEQDPVRRWQSRWQRNEGLRALAGEALAQTAPPAFTNFTSLTMLVTNTPPIPKLFWFHARDLQEPPQRAIPPARVANAGAPASGRHAKPLNYLENTFPPLESGTNANLRAPAADGDATLFHFPGKDVTRFWLGTGTAEADGSYSVVCRVMGLWYPAIEQSLPEQARFRTDPRITIGSPQWNRLRELVPKMPDWFGVTAEIAGVPLLNFNDLHIFTYRTSGKGGGQTWQSTPSSPLPEPIVTTRRYEQGVELLKVNVHLTNPDMLFARQRTRSWLFGSLIAISAVVAIVGFISARSAFLRQQQLSEMKSNFVSSVSHELRAPIASVRLLAESLERGKVAEPAKQHEYFRFIVQECRRLSSLIENVLNFARIEQGRKQYEFEPTDLANLLRQTVKLMEPAAAEKQIQLRLDLGATTETTEGCSVSVDASAIQQALINLIDNALKHSPAGSAIDVSLTCSPSGRTKDQTGAPNWSANVDSPYPGREGRDEGEPMSIFQLSVSDQGPGIPPSEHDKIFERFYRRGSELRRETEGVGIGLSIVKHIVEAHDGRVRVESESGKGSRFVIELPATTRPLSHD